VVCAPLYNIVKADCTDLSEKEISMKGRLSISVILPLLLYFLFAANTIQRTAFGAKQVPATATISPTILNPTPTSVFPTMTTTALAVAPTTGTSSTINAAWSLELLKILTAWPLILLLIVLYFRTPIRTLLNQLANSLKVKSLRFKLFGQEVELTAQEVEDVLEEMRQESVAAMNELSVDEVALLEGINAADGRSTVLDLIPSFRRDSEEHRKLRKLRDRKLIRPYENGQWQPHKHPVMTRFGRLVWRLHSKVVAPPDIAG
jgi:hypothetical protein